MQAASIRDHLRFDVARLRTAAARLESVDGQLRTLRHQLEARARDLADEADGELSPCGEDEQGPIHVVPLRTAQAQATAALARRAALRDVLAHSGALSLVAAMAVARWVQAILTLSTREGQGSPERREALAKGHVDAGRLAHRMLATLRRGAGLRSGCGQLTCAVVVAELAPGDLQEFLDEQIEEGLSRALNARRVKSGEAALGAASAALRTGARLLERMAERAEPAVQDLVRRAERVEDDVAAGLVRE